MSLWGGEYFEGHHLPIDPAQHNLEIIFGEGSEEENSSSDENVSCEEQESD